MSTKQQQALFNAIYRLCKPLVRILLRNGIPFSGFTDILKQAYVEVAASEFGVQGRKQSDSRVSTITGLTRKEVARIKNLEARDEETMPKHYNRAARVVFGWVHDTTYHDKNGSTLELAFEGQEPSFASLVKAYSGDVPARAILDELVQVGVAELTYNNRVKLIERAYIPARDEIEKLHILGTDVSGLIQTIDRNIYKTDLTPFFQRKVYYDNLPEEALDEIRQSIEAHAQSLLEQMDREMSKHDRDVNPKVKGTGKKAAGISIFYFENDENVER